MIYYCWLFFVFGWYMYIKKIMAKKVAIIYIYLVYIFYIMVLEKINHLLALEFLLYVNGITVI